MDGVSHVFRRKQQGPVSQEVGCALWSVANILVVYCHSHGDAQDTVPGVS